MTALTMSPITAAMGKAPHAKREMPIQPCVGLESQPDGQGEYDQISGGEAGIAQHEATADV